MTTQDIIKFLPFDEKDKSELLKMYEFGDADQKYAINELVWTAYFDLYNDTLRDNIGREQDMVKFGQGEADAELYKRALQKTDAEMRESLVKGITDTDLSVARKAMEQIVTEMRAAKMLKPQRTTS